MRGSRQPAVRPLVNDAQKAFQALSRHRRTKIARTAHTTLVKADQWAHGGGAPAEIAAALEHATIHSKDRKSKKHAG